MLVRSDGLNVDASVIIPTLNRCEFLPDAVASVRGQNLPGESYEIIVVDNGASDETRALIEKLNHGDEKTVRYVAEPELGMHNARHAGADAASGDVLAFIDDDAVVDSEWLGALLAEYADAEAGCVGGKILPQWVEKPPDWVDSCYQGWLSLLNLGDDRQELDSPELYGCNFSIRRALLYEVGGFNPEGFGEVWLGDGETGLLRKVMAAGYKIIYTPAAIVRHVIPPERATLDQLKHRMKNQAACDGYADYKKCQRGFPGLLRSVIKFSIRALKARKRSLGHGRESTGHHLDVLKAAYEWRRAAYNLRLAASGRFRQMVLKEDWINTRGGSGE